MGECISTYTYDPTMGERVRRVRGFQQMNMTHWDWNMVKWGEGDYLSVCFCPPQEDNTTDGHGRAMWHFREAGKDGSSMLCKIIEDILGAFAMQESYFNPSVYPWHFQVFSQMGCITISKFHADHPLPPLNLWAQRRVLSPRVRLRWGVPYPDGGSVFKMGIHWGTHNLLVGF